VNKSLEQIEESLLVAKAQSGDGQAFRRLVDAYDRRLWYFVRRMMDDDQRVADLLQEVWLSVFKSLHRLSSPSAFRVWLYRIAHDRAVSELRRIGREIVAESVEDFDPPAAECEPALHISETAELIHRGLVRLSVDHRRVLTLLYLEEMSVAEIGEVLGCSIGTVKSRLHYARAALACWLKEQES
jgi:RNA polymerase sigma-70 factor, ECF subfamily